ncbi:MAG: DUF58 domain-containing protein [Candidatus Eremiobacteraeota bacterium]|nr:DUF58 domain-containing protein [Candidatus Eremiobacteraeota bacterium]
MNAFGARLRAALLEGRRANVRGYGIVAPRRADGYEFAELRGYLEGDDPRRIDWAATARAGALQTRVMLEDAALVLSAAVDSSASMHIGRVRSNYDIACAVARVWYGAATDDDRCARIGVRARTFPTVRGRAAAGACAELRDPAGADFGSVLRLAPASLPRGSRFLIVSDFFDWPAIRDDVRACTARFDVTALLAADPWRGDLPLGGFVRLRDAETGGAMRLYIDRASRERYRRAVAERERDVVAALHDTGARAAILDAARSPEDVLGGAFAIS